MVCSFCVLVPVKFVRMTLQGAEIKTKLTVVENESLSLECISSLGRPQPSITWYMGNLYSNANVISAAENNPTVSSANKDTYNFTSSMIMLNVTRTFHDKWIFCNAINLPTVETVSSNYSVLDVQCKYP